MTKTKILIISVSLIALLSTPKRAAGENSIQEPSFKPELPTASSISNNSLENALDQHSLDQLGNGLLVLAIAGFMIFQNRR